MSDRPSAAEVLPAAPPPSVRATRPRPAVRNYLAREEQRRIFWIFMPPACIVLLLLGWLERRWLAPPGPTPVPPIDTRLEPSATDPAFADAVVIEADADTPEDDAGSLGAPWEALAKVKDDTMFRGSEREAWFHLWMTLRSTDAQSLSRSSARRVGFSELYGQPATYRGRLVRFCGTLHRLEKLSAPPNDYDIRDYWQGWLEPEGGPVTPIVVYFLHLPAGMPHGMKIREEVDVVGYFFKRWAYAAADTVRIAPLVLALEPLWKPRPAAAPAAIAINTGALLTILALMLLTLGGIGLANRGPARSKAPEPHDLAAVLADVPLVSTEESLRRLAQSQEPAGPSHPEDQPS